MSEFIYQEPFPIECDKTQYRLLTKEYVKIVECDGRRILKVDPKGIELLAREAYTDVSFYLRPAHLEQLRHILEDPEASDNDKFVAYTMLLNQTVAAEGELPTCQDTGTAICIGKKGENVFTGADDAECIARGAYEAYKERNLRYSQVVPFTMTEEKNSGTNLPAQIDLYADKGNEYKFLFITKGGGSANKTFLYQQTKALLNEKSLLEFSARNSWISAPRPARPTTWPSASAARRPKCVWRPSRRLRQVTSTSCPPRVTKEDAASATWSGNRKSSRSAGRAVSAPSSAANTSYTTCG